MAKEFWERFRINDDGTLIENETGERFDFEIDSDTNQVSLIPHVKNRTAREKQNETTFKKVLQSSKVHSR
jgi:hypothetical protein